MNKFNIVIDELESKIERLKHKVKQSKVLCQNNTQGNTQIVFAHNVYGANKVLSYDITVMGDKPVSIVVKLDNVVITSLTGVIAAGDILLKSNKLYSLAVECTGEGMLAAKLKLDSADLRII